MADVSRAIPSRLIARNRHPFTAEEKARWRAGWTQAYAGVPDYQRRAVADPLTAMTARQRHGDRRRAQQLPFRNRWLIVKLRTRLRVTWRDLWEDLIYLVRG